MDTFTLGTAAKRLKLSKPTIARYVREGKLAGRRLDDGSYEIRSDDLAQFEATYQRPKTGKRQGEQPSAKRDTAKVQADDLLDLQRQNERLKAIADLAEAQKDMMSVQVELLTAQIEAQSKDLNRLSRELEGEKTRYVALQDQLADITKAILERGQAPWWQRLIGKG